MVGITIVLGVFSSLVFYFSYFIESVNSIPMKATVVSENGFAGFDVNTTVISFGRVSPGASSIRTISLRNLDDQPKKISLFTRGTIAGMVRLPSQPMFLLPNEVREVILTLFPGPAATLGFYSGDLVMIAWKG